jgi:hypothetical protein
MKSQQYISCLLITALLIAAPQALAQSSWTDSIEFGGDTRVRFESIDAEGSAQRDRSRFRARFGLEAKPSDDIKLVFRLATGDGSPVSTNVTMDGGFSGKDILVDRAYVDWRINESWNVHAGKIKSPWFRPGGSPMLWDSDLNPEGIALHGKNGAFFGSLAALSVEERSSADDSLLLTAQGGWQGEISDAGSLTAGLGYYSYTNARGQTPFYNGSPNGNTVDAAGNYLSGFRLVELFAEYKTKLNDMPLTVYADVVRNSDASNGEDLGWSVGATLSAGKMQYGYAWLDIEADAVVGTFSDSNFGGGETDAHGHFMRAKYAIRDNVDFGATLIINERGGFSGPALDYDRVMLDVEFSF